jgi:hypothetical protein
VLKKLPKAGNRAVGGRNNGQNNNCQRSNPRQSAGHHPIVTDQPVHDLGRRSIGANLPTASTVFRLIVLLTSVSTISQIIRHSPYDRGSVWTLSILLGYTEAIRRRPHTASGIGRGPDHSREADLVLLREPKSTRGARALPYTLVARELRSHRYTFSKLEQPSHPVHVLTGLILSASSSKCASPFFCSWD